MGEETECEDCTHKNDAVELTGKMAHLSITTIKYRNYGKTKESEIKCEASFQDWWDKVKDVAPYIAITAIAMLVMWCLTRGETKSYDYKITTKIETTPIKR